MTTFQIVSDIHIEYRNNSVPDPLSIITPSADILILAGDIGSLYKFNQLKQFLCKLSIYFMYIIYVPGNHEYYEIDDIKPMTMNELTEKFIILKNEIGNLYILNRDSITINDICITGCTLWSNPLIKLPKFVKIFGIDTTMYNNMFLRDLSYINKMINYCKVKKLKLIVVTHYCPTYQIINERKKKNRYVSLYTSDLDHLLYYSKVHTWICGHIHSNFDMKTKGGTRIVGNQKGKPRDYVNDYSKSFTIIV